MTPCRHCHGTGAQSVEANSSLRYRCPDCNGRGFQIPAMTISTNYSCPNCGEDIEVEVEVNEGDDLPELCPHCKAPIPDDAHDKVAEDAVAEAADRMHDRIKDDF